MMSSAPATLSSAGWRAAARAIIVSRTAAGSRSARDKIAESAPLSRGSITNPETSCVMSSRVAPARVEATASVPQATASASTAPNGSDNDGNTNRSAACIPGGELLEFERADEGHALEPKGL
jgi:hypothetical protein